MVDLRDEDTNDKTHQGPRNSIALICSEAKPKMKQSISRKVKYATKSPTGVFVQSKMYMSCLKLYFDKIGA